MADFWNTDWLTRSEIFAPLRPVASRLPALGWPDLELLNALADESGRVVNARGLRVRFVPQAAKPDSEEDGFEPRAYLRGEVQVRPFNWHDLFNALVWMTFPTAKAVINARHVEDMQAGGRAKRSPQRDALTLFDEDGVVVLSSDPELLDLVRQFCWKRLFVERREEVREKMRFCVFGHALYQKGLKPFVGMTGKAVLLEAPVALNGTDGPARWRELDRLLSTYLWNRETLTRGSDLAPLPVLGIPGWWPGNSDPAFYDNTHYFRPGRGQNPAGGQWS
jgi:hypothetical protein